MRKAESLTLIEARLKAIDDVRKRTEAAVSRYRSGSATPPRPTPPTTQQPHSPPATAPSPNGVIFAPDAARRSAALAAMQAESDNSRTGSPLRDHWSDFKAAQREVEQKMRVCRERAKGGGIGKYFDEDGFAGAAALGQELAQRLDDDTTEWRSLREIAHRQPQLVVVSARVRIPVHARTYDYQALKTHNASFTTTCTQEGYQASDISQGDVGDCWFIASLAHLTQTPRLLDSALVTGELNDEGVYCVRFWVVSGGGWW